MSFQEREDEHIKSIKRKNEILEQVLKAEREKECTFQPELGVKTDEVSFPEFLKKQEEHLKKKEQYYNEKVQEKKTEQENLLQSKPNISDGSRVLAEGLGSTANERLLGKKFKLPGQSDSREKAERRAGIKVEPPTFKPVINDNAKTMKREGKIEETLYHDAIRRRIKSSTPPKHSEPSMRLNNTDSAYVQKKFEREFNVCAKEVQADIMNYEDVNKFLKALGCVISAADEELVPDFWKLLEGEKRGGITKLNFKTALKAILRITMENGPADSDAIFSAEGVLSLSEKQSAAFHNKFTSFHINQRQHLSATDSKGNAEYSFKPQISKKSEELATAARSKIEG